MWYYRKVHDHVNKNAGFTYSILAAISFKIDSLGKYTMTPSVFKHFKSTVEVIFLNAAEYRFQFPLYVRHCFKMLSLQFHFQFGKQSKITGGLLACTPLL
jgi:hypothetical protein